VRFKFDRVPLKKGVYSPQAHGDLELEQNAIRKMLVAALVRRSHLEDGRSELAGRSRGIAGADRFEQVAERCSHRNGALNVQVKQDDTGNAEGRFALAALGSLRARELLHSLRLERSD
jgi:hypothetical protein